MSPPPDVIVSATALPSAARHAMPQEIVRLPNRARHQLRSYLALPTLPAILSALVHNALQANPKRVDLHLCISYDDVGATNGSSSAAGPPPSVACVDDGDGFDRSLFGRHVWRERAPSLHQMANVGTLSIATGTFGNRWAYVRMGDTTLLNGPADDALSAVHVPSTRARGSCVSVSDLYASLPARRRALQSSASSTINACIHSLVIISLGWPDVRFAVNVQGSKESKLVLSIPAAKDYEERLAAAFKLGNAAPSIRSVDKVRHLSPPDSVACSGAAPKKRRRASTQPTLLALDDPTATLSVNGLLLLSPAPKGCQAIFFGRQLIEVDSHEGAALHEAVQAVYARSAFSTSETRTANKKQTSPTKGVQARPGYVLHVSLRAGKESARAMQQTACQDELVGLVARALSETVAEELVESGLLTAKMPKRERTTGLKTGATRPDATMRAEDHPSPIVQRHLSRRPTSKKRKGFSEHLAEAFKARNAVAEASQYDCDVVEGQHLHCCDLQHAQRDTSVLSTAEPHQELRVGQHYLVDERTGDSLPVDSEKRVPLAIRKSRRLLDSGRAATDSSLPGWLEEAMRLSRDSTLPAPAEADIPCVDSLGSADVPIFKSTFADHPSRLPDRNEGSRPSGPNYRLASKFFSQRGASKDGSTISSLRAADLTKARVLKQVDNKFIACTMPLQKGQALVLVDQHAADERIRFELLLRTYLEPVLASKGKLETFTLPKAHEMRLPSRSVASLCEDSTSVQVLESLGFGFGAGTVSTARGPTDEPSRIVRESRAPSGSTLIIRTLPSLLKDRLTDLNTLSAALEDLVDWIEEGGAERLNRAKHLLGRKRAVRDERSGARREGGEEEDQEEEEEAWLTGLRHLPPRILEMIASKACRGAIMFNDALQKEQCERMLQQLASTRFPFQCAHGR
ncbi:DNA mismatch repair protein-MLH3 family [Ceraceosorus bombacis]|uniref:DNA mismatch repair protein-MLH3 family n=1 Tax=Ceraceosorus bombacis TaxID=401625 RepID=A0A0P1BL39_9BASI|nr:DNA mismatch repair protein-MLH3 family [Ceraceosorus bombacis]